MSRLSAKDIGLINNCVREIYSGLDSEAFADHILSAISRIIPSEIRSYRTVLPLKHKSIHFTVPSEVGSAKNHAIYSKFMYDHPHLNLLYPEMVRSHPFKKDITKKADRLHILDKIPSAGCAVRISDFLNTRQYHSLGLYNELFRKLNVEYQISIPIQNNKHIHTALTFNRDLMDFSERERLILNLLGPHIIQAYYNTELLSNAGKKVLALERAMEEMDSYMIAIDRACHILFSSEKALPMLTESFKGTFCSMFRLPPELERWVRYQRRLLSAASSIPAPPAPLVIDKPDYRLIIKFIRNSKKDEDILILRKESKVHSLKPLQYFGITEREAVVLYWVACGKSNSSIASILNIKIATVKKHLERIYQKLGVENRVSAALMSIDVLGMPKRDITAQQG